MKKNLFLKSKDDSLRVVETFIDELSEKFKFSIELYTRVLISSMESVKNAMSHGNKFDLNKLVTLRIIIDSDKLVIITKDQGNGFDYRNVPDPTEPENIEKITGRGIFLMKNLSDRLYFHDGGRVSELAFALNNCRNKGQITNSFLRLFDKAYHRIIYNIFKGLNKD